MGMLMLRELVRQGVEVDLYLATVQTVPVPIEPMPGLRIIVRRSGWQWGRWYSRNKMTTMFSGLATRALSSVLLSLRLLREHRSNPYDAVYQLSQTELFLLGRVGSLAPPIIVNPCSHAAGELHWHRAEEAYALQSERRVTHIAIRAFLTLRSRLQPRELARADVVVGPSERFNRYLQADYSVPAAKLRVLRHPVDLERFAPAPEAARKEPRTLLFISRISARKGLAEIVELSHRLADLAGTVRLLVVGGATLWSDYRAHLAELNPDIAEYGGQVPSADVPALMRSATMLLVPSRYEPGPIVTGEALACGLPVVQSDHVGAAEVVRGPHARVYKAGDVEGLEAAVRSMLAAVEREEDALRRSARANAEEEFDVRRVIAELRGIVADVRSPDAEPVASDDRVRAVVGV
jgi:glycosyltransferase involved in cell wall biosynthesis